MNGGFLAFLLVFIHVGTKSQFVPNFEKPRRLFDSNIFLGHVLNPQKLLYTAGVKYIVSAAQ